ncbi:MAG: M42 family peptidase [Oscillospiraceae bacterium]|nr:M42 family peptidase [Oscillospiraceae bacterium]
MIDINLLKKLCLAFGPSGNEDEVRDIITEEIKNSASEYYTDKVGNLIVFKKGGQPSPKKRLFAAHMDEVGFMITSAGEDGYLKFKNLGGIESTVILGKQAVVGEKRLPAVFGGKPVHLIKKEDRDKPCAAEDIYLDTGVMKKEIKKTKQGGKKTEKPAQAGDFAVFKSDFWEFGENKIKCKAIDDRFGCCILIALIKSNLARDAWFAFTTCEEIGLRGAKTAANIIEPETALIFEATTAGDIYDQKEKNKICSLGGGAVISIMDNAAIYDKKLIEKALETAARNNIKTQIKQAVAGANESGAYQRSGGGAGVLAISLPARYIHSPCSVADLSDMQACMDLAVEIEKVI